MSQIRFSRIALAAIVAAPCISLVGCADSTADLIIPSGMSIVTEPSATRHLPFPSAGIIRENMVKDGDHVKAGQLLMKQDSDLDAKELERLKVEGFSDSRIEAAQADLDSKQIDYEIKSKAPEGYSAIEIREAKAKLTEAQKGVKVAEEDKQQAKIKYDQEQVRIDKMELHSPVDGIVEKVNFDVGEMADPQNKDGAIVVVKNDPLWVEIRGLTTYQVSTLKLGDKLQVRYLNDKAGQWLEAPISYITPVADAGADRQTIRLELPNPDGRAAGMRMEMKLSEKLQNAGPGDILSSNK